MTRTIVVDGTSYDIGKIIGEGTYGIVREASTVYSGNIYAVKSMAVGDIDTFNTETSALQILDHPNIIAPIGISIDDKEVHIVMRNRGSSLSDRKIENSSVRKIMFQLFHSLLHMEDREVIHRDIKPDNILIDGNMTPVIIDFGISSIYPSDRTITDVTTCGYRPPFLITDRYVYDNRLDVWSMGVVMYNILTGKSSPFGHDNDRDYLNKLSYLYPEEETYRQYRREMYMAPPSLSEILARDGIRGENRDFLLYVLRADYIDIPSIRDCLNSMYFSGLTFPMYPEISNRPYPYPMKSTIDRRCRRITFNWISDICRIYQRDTYTLLSIISLFDRYEKSLSEGHRHRIPGSGITSSIPSTELQIVAIACAYLVMSSSFDFRYQIDDIVIYGDRCTGSKYIDFYVQDIYRAVGFQTTSYIPSTNKVWSDLYLSGDILDRTDHRVLLR